MIEFWKGNYSYFSKLTTKTRQSKVHNRLDTCLCTLSNVSEGRASDMFVSEKQNFPLFHLKRSFLIGMVVEKSCTVPLLFFLVTHVFTQTHINTKTKKKKWIKRRRAEKMSTDDVERLKIMIRTPSLKRKRRFRARNPRRKPLGMSGSIFFACSSFNRGNRSMI